VKTLKIGVIGCGAIAQVHHMPNLVDLHDLFEVKMVCDLSPGAAEYVATKFNVPQFTTNYYEILDSDVDAILHCAGGYKPSAIVAAFEAGKHVFVEKPLCSSLEETDRIITARKKSGTVGQVGYMKVHDPAFIQAKQEVETMDNIQFVQVNHLHPNNSLHMCQFDVRRFDDMIQDSLTQQKEAADIATYAGGSKQAIGDVEPHVQGAFSLLSGSMIHDIYGMRVMLGMPKRVVSTEIWRRGRAITYTLEYPAGYRLVASWVDLPDLWDFKETLEIYGDDKRVILSYPTGFSRGIPSRVTIQGIDSAGTSYASEPVIDWQSAFMQELRHFHDCVINGTLCRTSIESARDDIALIIDIIKCYCL